MELKTLKYNIEHGILDNSLIIFKKSNSDSSNFLCCQYKNAIINNCALEVVHVDTVDTLIAEKTSVLFGDETFVVCDIDKFAPSSDALIKMSNILIVCNSVDISNFPVYNNYIIEFGDVENWCVEDYIGTNCSGITDNEIRELAKSCNYNLYRVDNEINKIKIFDEYQQSTVYQSLVEEGFLSDTTSFDAFSLVNPILQHKFDELTSVWKSVELFDSDPMFILSILISQYRTIIDVLLYPNSTPDICGISQKRFNAIKYYYRNYTKKQLVSVYMFLCDIDRQLKSGELSDFNLLDYIIIEVIEKGLAK